MEELLKLLMGIGFGEPRTTNRGANITREVSYDGIREFDAYGNLLHYKSPDGYEFYKEYDAYGNETRYVNSEGCNEYYKNGKTYRGESCDDLSVMRRRMMPFNVDAVYREVDYDGLREFDANGNLVHYRSPDGYEFFKEYDACGNVVRYRNSEGCNEAYDRYGHTF